MFIDCQDVTDLSMWKIEKKKTVSKRLELQIPGKVGYCFYILDTLVSTAVFSENTADLRNLLGTSHPSLLGLLSNFQQETQSTGMRRPCCEKNMNPECSELTLSH